MEDKIIQITGFGVKNTKNTQCDYMIAGLTKSGKVVITQGDGIWTDIGPRERRRPKFPEVEYRTESEERKV